MVNKSVSYFVCAVLLSFASMASGWLYTLPEGSCSTFSTCHDCVVEYAYDFGSLRRPCTWCPASNSCEMMNQWSEYCQVGDTYRETCPIMSDLPNCVWLRYSFWTCGGARPQSRDQCDEQFVSGFCTQQTGDKEVELCNGDSGWLEQVETGWGTENAFTVDKNAYGLELNLKYVWFNAGYGEDRRRIETSAEDDESDPFTWLCNADMNDQAIVMEYRVQLNAATTPAPSAIPTPSSTLETNGASTAKSLLLPPPVIFRLLLALATIAVLP